jgi:hypothetical protein
MHGILLAIGLALGVAATPVLAAVPAASQIEVIEFYHERLDHYFISADPKEIADLDSGVHAGWVRTGKRFQAVKAGAQEPNTAPICRFYGKPEAGLDSHFYTATAAECETVKQAFPDEWLFESGEVFRAFAVDPDSGKCAADTAPVHRLWNKRVDVNHRYTDELSVFQSMVEKGYVPEGNGNPTLPVVFCVPAKSGTNAAPAGSPVCTLTPSATTPTVGQTIVLTASCTGTPSSYAWTGCVITTNTNTCTATATVGGMVTYGVSATNLQGTGAAATTQVDWKGSSGPLPICTVTAPTLVPNAGSSLVLSASCSQTPTRYDWYECSYLIQAACNKIPKCSSTSQTCAISNAFGGFAHYAVSGVNGNGVGPKAGIDVEWKGTGSPTPPPTPTPTPPPTPTPTPTPTPPTPTPPVPPPSSNSCAQYSTVNFLDVPWGSQAVSRGNGEFHSNGVLVAQFTVPLGFASSNGSKGKIQHAEFGDSPTYRQASLSTMPCDFRGAAVVATDKYQFSLTGGGASLPLYWSFGNTGYIEFTVTGTAFNTTQLVPGQTYYYNVRNYSPDLNNGAGGNSCSGGVCNVIISINTP